MQKFSTCTCTVLREVDIVGPRCLRNRCGVWVFPTAFKGCSNQRTISLPKSDKFVRQPSADISSRGESCRTRSTRPRTWPPRTPSRAGTWRAPPRTCSRRGSAASRRRCAPLHTQQASVPLLAHPNTTHTHASIRALALGDAHLPTTRRACCADGRRRPHDPRAELERDAREARRPHMRHPHGARG